MLCSSPCLAFLHTLSLICQRNALFFILSCLFTYSFVSFLLSYFVIFLLSSRTILIILSDFFVFFKIIYIFDHADNIWHLVQKTRKYARVTAGVFHYLFFLHFLCFFLVVFELGFTGIIFWTYFFLFNFMIFCYGCISLDKDLNKRSKRDEFLN